MGTHAGMKSLSLGDGDIDETINIEFLCRDRRNREVGKFPQCSQKPFRYFAAFFTIEITTEFLFVGMATTT